MNSGLLWYDNDPQKSLADKIAEAARRYQDKFGVRPNACFLNHLDFAPLDNNTLAYADVIEALAGTPAEQWQPGATFHVAPKTTILKNHLWLGVDEQVAVVAGKDG